MAQLDDNQLVPPLAKTAEDVEKDAEQAVAYLKRTDNLDLAEILDLSTYLEDTDEQKAEDRSRPAASRE